MNKKELIYPTDVRSAMMLHLFLRICILFPLLHSQRIYQNGLDIYTQDRTEIQVFENVTVGSVVLPDIRDFLQMSFDRQVRLGPGAFSSFFSLTKNHSLIVQNSLDLESGELCRAEESCCRSDEATKTTDFIAFGHFAPACKIKAVILANSGPLTTLKPIGRMTAVIQDLNDNPPEFVLPKADSGSPTNRIHVSFFEGFRGVGEKFQLPTAKDKDFLPENSLITYSIALKKAEGIPYQDTVKNEIPASSGSPAWVGVGPFRLAYKPKEDYLTLEVAKELDRESLSEYELTLQAEDGEGQKANLAIQVHVLDVNEFAPTFIDVRALGDIEITKALSTKKAVIQIYENASVHKPFVQVIAEDKEAPPANQIAYSFAPNFQLTEAASLFSIESNTGKISLEKALDYEQTKRYVLPVQAIDANYDPNVAEMKLLPQSLQKVMEAIIDSIKKEPKTALITLEIIVNDCNDHAPEIKLQGAVNNAPGAIKASIEELTVMENAPLGTSLVFFSAKDRDHGEAGTSQCHLLNWTDKFRIHNFSDFFSLETVKELDREVQSQYLLTVECYDNGNPRQHSQKRLRVSLLDVNDEAPLFQHPFNTFHVLENSPPRTKLIPVSESTSNPVVAFDKDINSTLTFHLEPATSPDLDQRNMFDYQLFEVDSETGALYTKGELDREQRAVHKFSLCAEDGIHKACTSVIVHLDDINDNPPLFDKETYIIRVIENTQVYEPLIDFHVTDVDTGNQGFSVVIEPPQYSDNSSELQNFTENLHHYFLIRDNKLFLRQPLDRELKSHYHFFVRVADSQIFGSGRAQESLSSTAEVFIEVSDLNDNAPVFIFPNTSAANEGGNQLNVSCRETMGSSVGRVAAIDLDLEHNGTVVYNVIQGPVSNELFYLDKLSGELFVNSGRLSENCDSVFLIVISADDMGPPSSKKGRPVPVERLLIRLQDQPTLAEYMSLNSQKAANAKGRNDSRGDRKYFGMPTKTMLSVVLGGCVLFLIGLFLAWIILMLVSRSKRRRRERHEDEEGPYQPVAAQCREVGTFLSDGKHEIFVHPHGLGLTGNRPFSHCLLTEKDDGVGCRDINTEGSVSSRASPYGQSLNEEIPQSVATGRFTNCPSKTNTVGRITRASPVKFKSGSNPNAGKSTWSMAGGGSLVRRTPGATKMVEDSCNFAVVPTSPSLSSGDATRYLLVPAFTTAPSTILNVPSTSHTGVPTQTLLKHTKQVVPDGPSSDLRWVCGDMEQCNYQNNTAQRTLRPFLTPPPKSKSPKPDQVVENMHFILNDNHYTRLEPATTSNDQPGENQYLIISSRGSEMTPVYNTISRLENRGSSLPRSLHTCKGPLKNGETGQEAPMEGVLLVPSQSNGSASPMLNNILHPKATHRLERGSPSADEARTHLRTDYISLEDLFSSCV